ncbi:MAG: HupE/UreJ family protein [Acidobacteriota bacterium]|nr:HupE/UreJ family protein [Acidobacteriota bacterium]
MKAVFLPVFFALAAFGHDIPNDVLVQSSLEPSGHILRFTVHVPLAVLRDIDFPEQAGGTLDLARVDPALREGSSLWLGDAIELFENGERLLKPTIAETHLSLLSDRTYSPLPPATKLFWNQAELTAVFESPIQSDRSRFSIDPAFGRLGQRVITVLRFRGHDLELSGEPGLIRLDPHWYQAALSFVRMGFLHILDGADHLLFLFCLVIPLRRFRALIPVVTAFTAAHSVTLIASAYGLAPSALWFPPLIETLIAASIVYMALENIVGLGGAGRRWVIAFGFGLVHGFGFSFALRETLQFAGSHLLTALLSFNIGVELGQLLVLAAMIPALELFFRKAVSERTGTIVLSALAAHTGWHWMTGRWDRFRQYRFELPQWDAATFAAVSGWLLILGAALGALWFVNYWLRARPALPAARPVPPGHASAARPE